VSKGGTDNAQQDGESSFPVCFITKGHGFWVQDHKRTKQMGRGSLKGGSFIIAVNDNWGPGGAVDKCTARGGKEDCREGAGGSLREETGRGCELSKKARWGSLETVVH